MKIRQVKRILSLIIAGAMVFNMAAVRVNAEEANDPGEGKYVKDVFIAYGKTEEKAKEWLDKNGWEALDGDYNAGKASYWDDSAGHRDNVAAVMGIKRTDDKDKAITDMAVMNMEGGYSMPDYKSLLGQKKAEIKEFVNSFMVTVQEYRANLNDEGSEFGKKRAAAACDILNRFIDGNPKDPVAVNDTGEKLGDLFKKKTRQEGNTKGADLEQMVLETSGPAMLAVEVLLAIGADTAEDTWIERAGGLTGDELAENLPKYVPAAAGQDIAPSAIGQYLGQTYGDTARILAQQWTDINDAMLWYEDYNEQNDLWPHDDESEDDYAARVDQFFDEMKKADEEKWEEESNLYFRRSVLYYNLYECPYAGDWGESLGDFFNPAGDAKFREDADNFLPMAAALSEGQRAAIDFLSLQTLLMIGFSNEKALEFVTPDLSEIFEEGMDEVDVYLGVNREAFRDGVAMTSKALMDQKAGKGEAFDQIWDNTGIVAITTYASAVIGAAAIIAGGVMIAKGKTVVNVMSQVEQSATLQRMGQMNSILRTLENPSAAITQNVNNGNAMALQNVNETRNVTTGMGYAGRAVLGIGGALLIGAAIVSAVRLWKYYDRDMKPIPRMIVDESDIVTYLTDDDGKPILDENGNQKKNIDFNTFEYYTAVKCNRPDVGNVGGDWNDGVNEYKDHNCYDVADLNCDMGQEWLALYTVKSKNKGNPILADTLTLKYGKDKSLPEKCTTGLHLFCYTNTVDLGDTAWAYNNKKNGVRLYWGEDEKAFAADTASSFSGGQIALAGILGLIVGILGSSLVLIPRRKKRASASAQNETTA